MVQFFGSKKDLRLANLLMMWLEGEGARQALLGRVRSAASEPAAADAVREMIGVQLTDFAQLMGGDRPDVRASLLATQLARPDFDLYLSDPLDDSD